MQFSACGNVPVSCKKVYKMTMFIENSRRISHIFFTTASWTLEFSILFQAARAAQVWAVKLLPQRASIRFSLHLATHLTSKTTQIQRIINIVVKMRGLSWRTPSVYMLVILAVLWLSLSWSNDCGKIYIVLYVSCVSSTVQYILWIKWITQVPVPAGCSHSFQR